MKLRKDYVIQNAYHGAHVHAMPDYTQQKRGYKSAIHYPTGGANVPTPILLNSTLWKY